MIKLIRTFLVMPVLFVFSNFLAGEPKLNENINQRDLPENKRMWDDIEKKEEPNKLNSEEELNLFSEEKDISLSEDHKFFLKNFGEGVIFNHIRVFGIQRIRNQHREFQERWGTYFLWDDPESELNEEDMKSCIIIGDTFNGDELVIFPEDNSIYYLPQDDKKIINLALENAIQSLVQAQIEEVKTYSKQEQEEWDLVPVFSVSSF